MSYYEEDKFKNDAWKDLGSIILAFGAATLYRMGGSGRYARFFRPLGIGIAVTLGLWLIGGFHWSIFLSGGASAGLSTTYFHKKDTPVKWYNWLLVGFAMSMAVLPWVLFYSHNWIGFLVRTLMLTPMIVLWCEIIGNDVAEELGRGFLIIITLLLFLIGS